MKRSPDRTRSKKRFPPTLGVPVGSDLSIIRRRYRQELVRFHPDRFVQITVEGEGSDDTSAVSGPMSGPAPDVSTTGVASVSTSTAVGDDTWVPDSSDEDDSDTLDGESEFDGGDFILIPDGGCGAGLPPGTIAHCSFECSFWEQDCPLGNKCTPWASGGGGWNSFLCVEVAAEPTTVGAPCLIEDAAAFSDECDYGLMCVHVDSTETGARVELCTGSEATPLCSPGTTCRSTNDGVWNVCVEVCDPLQVDACPIDQSCVMGGGLFSCVALYEPGKLPGDACEYIDECPLGTSCIDAMLAGCDGPEENCCAPHRDLNAGDPDAACINAPGGGCAPAFEDGEAPKGLAHVGLCLAG